MRFHCGHPVHQGERGTPDPGCEHCHLLMRAREAERENQAEARARRKTPLHYNGVSLVEAVREFRRLPAFDDELSQYRLSRVTHLRIRWSSVKGVGGRAASGGRISMTIGIGADLPRVLETLLHEMVHVSLPPEVHHGEAFVRRLVGAARDAWGIVIENPMQVPLGGRKNRAYAVDDLILEALRKGRVVQTPIPLPPPPVDLAQVRRDRVAKRAARARQLLEQHERKLKREAKLVQKWRRTVRYYERAAAKTGGVT